MWERSGSKVHQRLLASAAAIVVAASAGPALAQTRTFNVPAGPASRSIPIFAKQAGVQILASGTAVKSKRTKAVKGNLTAEEGLRLLLDGSGLVHSGSANGIITIVAAPTGYGQTISSTADGESLDEDARGQAEILVVGSRSRNVDIRRTEDDDQPYIVFDKDEVQASQATTVEEFLRTRLPQNASPQGSGAQISGAGIPYSSFNLRGLGANQTLILVNGRRLADLSNANGAPAQADINGIPLSSIERIEVLPSSAGGVYGGNAVGGVINVILRSDYRGFEITASYNDTFDFRAPNGRLDVNGGFSLEGGRTTVTFGGSISRSGTLLVRDRIGLIRDGAALGNRNRSPYLGNGTPPLGNGVNIRSTTGANLQLDPQYGGANLGSNLTNLPLGYAGVGSDNGAALIAGAGRFNLDIPDDLSGLKRGLLTSPEIGSFNVSVRRKFTDWLDIFVDYSRLQNSGTSYSAGQLSSQVILPANASTNPFQQQISVTFPNTRYSFPYTRTTKGDRLTAGAIIRLPGKWGINAEYNKSWSKSSSVGYQAVIETAGRTCGLSASTAPSCAGRPVLNPLQAPIDYGAYLFTEPTYRTGPYGSQFDNPSIRASGPLFALPGGSASLTVALQREELSVDRALDQTFDATTRAPLYVQYAGRSQRTDSAYGELVLPLVSPANNILLMRELELRGAVRHDAYLTKSPPLTAYSVSTPDASSPYPAYTELEARLKSTNFTIAGRYSPFKGVVLRASYASGFLPPNVAQLATITFASLQLSPDPLRGNLAEAYPISITSGLGSASLQPEHSKSLSIGIILTPLKNLRFSADFTRIKKDGEVGSIPTSYLLGNSALFPGRVIREPAAQPGDPEGFAGRIISIDNTPLNLFRSKYQAVDFQLDYSFETSTAGKFRAYGVASWQPDSIRQLVIQAPALNYSGNRDGPLEWQGNAGLDWTYGKLSVRWNTQYFHSYNIYTTQNRNTAAGAASIASAITLQGSSRVPSQLYSDLYLSYDFNAAGGLLNGIRISAGVQNVFDKTPPVIAITSYSQAGYSTYGDPRLRRFTLSVRKAFDWK